MGVLDNLVPEKVFYYFEELYSTWFKKYKGDQ